MKRFAATATGWFLTSVLLAATARAQAPEQEPPRYRASLTYGLAGRSSDRTVPSVVPLHIGGVSPSVFHFSGAYFFIPWLGAALDASFETYAVQGQDLNKQRVSRQLFGLRAIAEAVGRWSPKRWVGLELHLGYAGGMWPSIRLQGSSVVSSPIAWHGPSIGFAISLEPDAPIGGQLFGRFIPGFGIGTGINPASLSSGLQLHFLNLALTSELRLAILLEGEVIGAGGAAASESFSQLQIRGALGLRLRDEPPKPSGDVGVGTKEGNGRIRGRVVTAGIGLSGVSVTSDGLPPATTGPDGDFEFADVAPGPRLLKALLAGYKPAEQLVDVPAGDEAVVTLQLAKPTGPGRIKGVVKGEKDAPVADADVAADGKPAVKSGADGSYSIDAAGPGPVKVTVTAKGYKPAEDAAQVPPEGLATLDFTLVKAGVAVPATIRGLVRAASGKVVKATVKISDVNLTVPIKGDGRFVVQVPGGKYTVTIEAAGYVTQVKSVEVADGDQAIFQVDLQPIGR